MQSIRFANVIIKLLGRQTTGGIHLFLKITDWAIICNQKIVYSDENPSLKLKLNLRIWVQSFILTERIS